MGGGFCGAHAAGRLISRRPSVIGSVGVLDEKENKRQMGIENKKNSVKDKTSLREQTQRYPVPFCFSNEIVQRLGKKTLKRLKTLGKTR